METIYEIDTIKSEKEKAMRRYKTFNKIANIIRSFEIFLAIAFVTFSISWISSLLPTLFDFSVSFSRRFLSLLLSLLFVFVVGNVIVITLFAKSSPSPEIDDVDVIGDLAVVDDVAPLEVVEKVYKRSQSTAVIEVVKPVEKKELRRSRTVPRRKIGSDDVYAAVNAAKAVAETVAVAAEEEEMNDDEFNRRVEEFIKKQRKFLCEESKILVLT